MFDLLALVSPAIGGLRDRSSSVMLYVFSAVALLVVASSMRDERPTVTLSVAAWYLGFDGLEGWLSAPPPLLAIDAPSAVPALVLLALACPFVALLPGEHASVQSHLGSPASGTAWFVLLVAAQVGPLPAYAVGWVDGVERWVSQWLALIIGGLVVGLVGVCAARSRWGLFDSLCELTSAVVLASCRFVRRPLLAALTVVLGMAYMLAAVPIRIAEGLLDPESARSRRIQAKLDADRLTRLGIAQGAPVRRFVGS